MSTRSIAQTLTGTRAWQALEDHGQTIRNLHLPQVFADDPLCSER